MFYLGEPSKTLLRVYIPESTINITIENGSINFKMRQGDTAGQYSDITEMSSVNISGNLSAVSGVHCISIESLSAGVWVNDTSCI